MHLLMKVMLMLHYSFLIFSNNTNFTMVNYYGFVPDIPAF